jgi:hypothetical protein
MGQNLLLQLPLSPLPMIIPPICHTYLTSRAGVTGLSEATVPTDSLSPHPYNYQKTFTVPNIPISFVDLKYAKC